MAENSKKNCWFFVGTKAECNIQVPLYPYADMADSGVVTSMLYGTLETLLGRSSLAQLSLRSCFHFLAKKEPCAKSGKALQVNEHTFLL